MYMYKLTIILLTCQLSHFSNNNYLYLAEARPISLNIKITRYSINLRNNYNVQNGYDDNVLQYFITSHVLRLAS